MNFLSPLFSWHFWFDLTPVRMTAAFEATFFAIFALCVVAGAVLRMYVRQKKMEKYQAEIFRRCASLCTYAGAIGLIWFFLTFEEIQFFGARFWFLLWSLIVGVIGFRIGRYAKNDVPLLERRDQSRAEVNRYLPRRAR